MMHPHYVVSPRNKDNFNTISHAHAKPFVLAAGGTFRQSPRDLRLPNLVTNRPKEGSPPVGAFSPQYHQTVSMSSNPYRVTANEIIHDAKRTHPALPAHGHMKNLTAYELHKHIDRGLASA